MVHSPPVDPLRLPRRAWEDHPRFRTQALLLGSHRSFRRMSERLVSRAESGEDSHTLGWIFQTWKGAMHSHERYEEVKLYPYLERRWGLSTAAAESGHQELAACEEAVLAALEPGGPASPTAVAALAEHDRVLTAHLALEEELVIPALLALSPEEFEDYARSTIRDLLTRLPADGVPPD